MATKLSASHETELRRHLETCPQCREAFERECRLAAAIDGAIERFLAAEPSAGFFAQVRERIAADTNGSKAGFWPSIPTVRWAALAIACAAVVAGGMFLKYYQPRVARSQAGMMTLSKITRNLSFPRRRESINEGHMAPRSPAFAEDRFRGGDRAGAGSRGTVSVPRERAAASTMPRLAGHARARRAAKASTPEVIVPKNQMALVLQLYYGTRSGEIDGASLVAVPPGFKREPDGSLGIAPIEIKPIQIAKLDVGPASPPAQSDVTRP